MLADKTASLRFHSPPADMTASLDVQPADSHLLQLDEPGAKSTPCTRGLLFEFGNPEMTGNLCGNTVFNIYTLVSNGRPYDYV